MPAGIEAPPPEEEARAAAGNQTVIFVLEGASLETAKVGKNYELLNCDDHAHFLRRHGRDPAQYRPDICHQVSLLCQGPAPSGRRGAQPAGQHCCMGLHAGVCSPAPRPSQPVLQALLAILDSPLNKAGRIKAIYVHTAKNVLVQVNPQVRTLAVLQGSCGAALVARAPAGHRQISEQARALGVSCRATAGRVLACPAAPQHHAIMLRRCGCRAPSGASAACWSSYSRS